MSCKEFRERLRFTICDDLILLRQVNKHNPYIDPSKWSIIGENVVCGTAKQFSLRSLKDHVKHLLNLYTKNDEANLKKSSTVEQYLEKMHLLKNIKEMGKIVLHLPDPELQQNGIETETQIKHEIETVDDKFNLEFYEINTKDIEETTTNRPLKRKHMHSENENNNMKMKERELKIEETKLELEKQKLRLEERRLMLDERRLKLEEDKFEWEKREQHIKTELN